MTRSRTIRRASGRSRPRHPALAAGLWILAALALGPVFDSADRPLDAAAAGSAAGDASPPDQGRDAVYVEPGSAVVVTGPHAAADHLAHAASAARLPDRPAYPDVAPAVPARALTHPFDRVSYRTTGPPLRVS